MQASDSTMTLAAVPSGAVQYPNWMVIEPDSANREIVYLPTAPSGTTYSGVVRGISLTADSDSAGTGIAHAANVDVVMSLTHRDWNDIVSWIQGTNGSGYNNLRVGDETDSNITIYAQNADGAKPYVQYNASTNKWLISNDGVSTFDITAGGSGLTRGLGVNISASAITLDVRTSGGLRNNQGTGSQQCDVDPTIVARLDTANTWTAAQTHSAAVTHNSTVTVAAGLGTIYVPTPTDPGMAVNKSYVDGSGTSGEAITAGQAIYVKASDGKLYKTDADLGDESTFSFIGFAVTTVAGADLTVYYVTPGRIVTGLSGLTAGSYYFLSNTAGAIGTTPGARYAKVAQALSTTSIRVIEPKFIASGNITLNGNGTFSGTTGFYPKSIRFWAAANSTTVSGGSFGESILAGTITDRCLQIKLSSITQVAAITTQGYNCYNFNTGVQYSNGSISAVTSTGFSVSNSNHNGQNVDLYWIAEN